MVKLRRPLWLVAVYSVAATLTLGLACSAEAKASKKRVEKAASVAGMPPSASLDPTKRDALQSAVVAFFGERECDDLTVDYGALDRRLKRAGLKPEDLGPRSPYGPELDLLRQEVFGTFLDNRRRACEQAVELVGESEAGSQAATASRLGSRHAPVSWSSPALFRH
jgi:hypothetical protein